MPEDTFTAAAPGGVNVEAVLATHAARRAVWVAPPILAFFWLFNGLDGAVASALGIGVVVVNFLASGWMLSVAAKVSLALYHAAALFGFFLRLVLITASLLLLAALTDLDRTALGLSVVAAYLVLLTWEAVAVAQGRERELDWL